jgi:hypothetical protein
MEDTRSPLDAGFRLTLLAIKFLSRLGLNPAYMHISAFGLQLRIGERPL